MNSIAVITRFHYLQDSAEYRWRLDYYRNEVLPRLLAQTDQEFDIWIWCEPWQDAELKALSKKINTFRATYEKRDSKLFIDYTAWENVAGLPKYYVQVGLDSDDLVSPLFITRVRSICCGDKSILASFQPLKRDLATGKRYFMDQYTEKRGSPIFAFYQPNFSNFKFAYHTSHLRMPMIAEDVVLIPEGYVEMTIHGKNDSTKIKPTDKRI